MLKVSVPFFSIVLFLLSFSIDAFSSDYRTCTRIVDGDILILDGDEKIRLIGVDTPETVHPQKPVEYFGKEASSFTRRMVQGKKVRLEYDWERQDKYGRTLAYVYLQDGTFLNAEIIKQGYGHAYTRFPFKYLDEFRAYEREARKRGTGLWGASEKSKEEITGGEGNKSPPDTLVYISQTGTKYHRKGCRCLGKSRIPMLLAEARKKGYSPCSLCLPPEY